MIYCFSFTVSQNHWHPKTQSLLHVHSDFFILSQLRPLGWKSSKWYRHIVHNKFCNNYESRLLEFHLFRSHEYMIRLKPQTLQGWCHFNNMEHCCKKIYNLFIISSHMRLICWSVGTLPCMTLMKQMVDRLYACIFILYNLKWSALPQNECFYTDC